ncbi:MAG: TRAFAC clade GTPase domain-containing protein [Streptosporangiaceae bacterium]
MSSYDVSRLIELAVACALALGVVLFAIALVQALVRDPELVVPAADQGEQVKAHPVGPGEFAPDLAWPFYPFRQSRADLERARANVAALNRVVWRRPGKAFFRGGMSGWWVLFPIPVVVTVFLLLASLTSWFCYLVYALVNIVATSASLALLVPVAALLRMAERWRRDRLFVQATCTRCFHVTPWPAYQCPHCLARHHDVSPGRLGLLLRRCECGTHLPTMAARAAWQVTALCQRCGAELPQGAGAIRDVRIPVFGDISAGKTRFLYASLNSLMQTAKRAGRAVSFPDESSRELAEFGLGVITSGRETAKTSTNAQVTLTCRLGTGRRSEFIHLFDAAGEHFRSARQPDTLRFLDDGDGLVYVLDPFSVEAVCDQLAGAEAAGLDFAHAAAGDPDLTYDEVVSRLRDSGIPASTQLLAVVVSKADLLRSAGLELPAGSAAIARWLRDAGVHNLVISAPREFAAVRFFTVASQNVPPGGQDDPGAPLRWLLGCRRVRLPADPADQAGSSGHADTEQVPSEPAEARS